MLQKFYANKRFVGKTPEDTAAAIDSLGHYSDIQSLNSEDAVTWSVFGNVAYLSDDDRRSVLNAILSRVDAPTTQFVPICCLWRRLPHPEKADSSGGPEIDFGFLSKDTLVLGEAKWNSPQGRGQGVQRDRTQFFLRRLYCEGLGRKALPEIKTFVILGVGRSASVFGAEELAEETLVVGKQMTWLEIAECLPLALAEQARRYLEWKSVYSASAPNSAR